MSEDAFERLARRRASGEITDEEYARQLDRLIVLDERVRFFRDVAAAERRIRRGGYEGLPDDMRRASLDDEGEEDA
jgi:hypothetical protein